MSWLKFELTTPDKPEVWQIAQNLGIDPDAVVGKLIRVWAWFDQHTNAGTNAPSVSRLLLDRYTGVSGFTEQMILAGWMTDDGKTIALPNFDRHNGMTAKTRAQTAKRVAKLENKRATNATANGASVSPSVSSALLEKSENREEKNDSKKEVEAKPRCVRPIGDWIIKPKGWTDAAVKALEQWDLFRLRVDSKMLDDLTLQRVFETKSGAGWTEEKFIKAVDESIANNWRNIHDPEDSKPTGRGKSKFGENSVLTLIDKLNPIEGE